MSRPIGPGACSTGCPCWRKGMNSKPPKIRIRGWAQGLQKESFDHAARIPTVIVTPEEEKAKRGWENQRRRSSLA